VRKLLEMGSRNNIVGSNLVKQVEQSLDASDNWSKDDIDQLLNAIIAKREQLDSSDRYLELSLLEDFILNTRRKRDLVMQRLQAEMQGLSDDLTFVQQELSELKIRDQPRKRKLDEEPESKSTVVTEHKQRLRPFVDDISDGYFEWRLDSTFLSLFGSLV
jgi:hypothetical protein